MVRVVRVNGNDKCRIEEQAGIGVEPGVAHAAGAKDAAVGAGIMRRRPA